MRVCGVSLVVVGALLAMIGTAMLTATHRPPEYYNWMWHFLGREVHANTSAVWWYTHDEGGFWSTDIVFWYPRVQVSYLSIEAQAHNLLKDWDTDEFRAESRRIRAIDDQKFWCWPDWHGLMKGAK